MSPSIIYILISALFIFMPLHYYICELFLSGTRIDNLLRDIVIILLFIIIFRKGKIRINTVGKIIIANILLMTVLAIISIAGYGNTSGKLNILRTYLVPCLMFFICCNYKFTETQFYKIQKYIVTGHAVIGIYGAFASFILGDVFLVKIGYPSEGGHLTGSSFYINYFFGHPRNTGTYVSPNTCGLMLAIAICVYFYSKVNKKLRHSIIVLYLLIAGLLTTLSRSAILGLVFGIAFATYLSGKKIKLTKKRLTFCLVATVFCLVAAFIVNKYFLNNILSKMLVFAFGSMFNGMDGSAAKHIEDLYKPLFTVITNPFGFGFGNNGPMALEFNENAYHVESSVYLMIYELGVAGGLLYFIPYILVARDTWKNRKKYKFYTPAAVAVLCMFTYLLLPNVQTYELLFYFFSFLGMYYNQSVMQIFKNDKGS